MTLAELIEAAQAEADYSADDDFITAATWKSWVNDAVKSLHKLETTTNRDSYLSTVDFTLTTTNEYALPADFMYLRGLTLNPSQANRQTIHKFNFGDRNAMSGPVNSWGGYLPPRQYRVVSRAKLVVEPKESAAGSYRLYYIPSPTVLTVDASTLDAALLPWSEFIVLTVAARAIAKEEGDTRDIDARILTMRQDILESVGPDDNEPDTVVDVQ